MLGRPTGAVGAPSPVPTLVLGPTGTFNVTARGVIPYGTPVVVSASGSMSLTVVASSGTGSNFIALYRNGARLARAAVSNTDNYFTVTTAVRVGDVIQAMVENSVGNGMAISFGFWNYYVRDGLRRTPGPTFGAPRPPSRLPLRVPLLGPGPCASTTQILAGPIAAPTGVVGLWITAKSGGNFGLWGGSIGGQNVINPGTSIGQVGLTGFFLYRSVTSPFWVYSFPCDASLVEVGWAVGL